MNEELYLVAYKDIEKKEIDEALWLKAPRQKALTTLEEVRWTRDNHRFEEDVRDLELRAPREEAPARKTTSTRFRRRRCKSEGLQSFAYCRTR